MGPQCPRTHLPPTFSSGPTTPALFWEEGEGHLKPHQLPLDLALHFTRTVGSKD